MYFSRLTVFLSCLALLCLSSLSLSAYYFLLFSRSETGAQRWVGPSFSAPHIDAPGTCFKSGVHPAAFSWAGPPIGQPSVQPPSQPGCRLRTWPATPAAPLPLPGLPIFSAPASPTGPQFAAPPCRLPHDVPSKLRPCSCQTFLSAYAAQSQSQPAL